MLVCIYICRNPNKCTHTPVWKYILYTCISVHKDVIILTHLDRTYAYPSYYKTSPRSPGSPY